MSESFIKRVMGPGRYADLENVLSNQDKDSVFCGEDYAGKEKKQYTDDEMERVNHRPLHCRLFFKNFPTEGDTVFLRTRFSDNHNHTTKIYNFVRDYLKAYKLKNHSAAKSSLTRLLTLALEMTESDYCTFATVMGSAFSDLGSNGNLSFEWSEDANSLSTGKDDDTQVAIILCKLMHIIFSKLKIYTFLITEEGSNAYRIVHCKTAIEKKTFQLPHLYALFSFALQICLTAYVIAQIVTNFLHDHNLRSDPNPDPEGELNYGQKSIKRNIVLAIFTVLYSSILAIPEFKETPNGFAVFGKPSILQCMDIVVNTILPTVLIVAGAFVILGQDSFIEAVLNTAALLFIPEIDDSLPTLLGFDEKAIVKNFLIHESMKEYDSLCKSEDENKREEKMAEYEFEGMGVQFEDCFLTNMIETGTDASEGYLYQPFQVSSSEYGYQIDPSTYVTEKCLIKKLTIKYTKFANTTHPRIGYMEIDLLDDKKDPIIIKRPENDQVELDEENVVVLNGVYVITSFQMSNDVIRLRVCGSKEAVNFEKAFDYYSLWGMNKRAKKLLTKAINSSKQKVYAPTSLRTSVNRYTSVKKGDGNV